MSDSGSDHEHWPNDFDMHQPKAVPVEGYDDHNGLHSHTYVPAAKEDTPPASHRTVTAEQQLEQMLTYVPAQHTSSYQPQAVYCMPAQSEYYQYIPAPAPPSAPAAPPSVPPVAKVDKGVSYTYYPSGATGEPTEMATNVWLGRSQAEVEEDNLKIAAVEKAYDKRKMVPTGLAEDQMCWVAEIGSKPILRTFAASKDLKGEWKQDPRNDSWYFVIEKEEKKK